MRVKLLKHARKRGLFRPELCYLTSLGMVRNKSTSSRDESLRSDSVYINKSVSKTSQRNEFNDIFNNVLNDHDLIEVRDITASHLKESDLSLHHTFKDDENSCANHENNDNDQDSLFNEKIL